MIIFDVVLYLYRMLLWELPWIGGRARGHRQPRAPSLNERPDGQRRAFGLRSIGNESGNGDYGQTDDYSPEDRHAGNEAELGKENMAPTTNERAHSSADGEMKHRVSNRT